MRIEATCGRNSKLPDRRGRGDEFDGYFPIRVDLFARHGGPALASALPMPTALQNTSYSGTSAQPNAKLPAVMSSSAEEQLAIGALLLSISDGCATPRAR